MSSPCLSGDSLLRSLFELQTEFLQGHAPRPLLERWLSLLLTEAGGGQGLLQVELPEAGAEAGLEVVASVPQGWRDGTDPPPSPLRVLPLHAGDVRVGLVNLSLRSEDSEEAVFARIQPLLPVGASLLQGWREARRREQETRVWGSLQSEREELRQQLASVEEDLWHMDLSTRALHPSRRWWALTGYTEDEFESTLDAWQRLCHPEDLPCTRQLITAHEAGLTPHVEFEYRVRCKNGEWAWLLTRGRVVKRDAQGQPVRIVGTESDLTATKRNEERLSALLLAIPDLIFRQTTDGTYLDFSCSTAERTLLQPEMFIGRNLRDLPLPRHLVELTLTNFERVEREGTLAVYEYELDMPQGRQSYEARVIRSGPREVVSIVRNVTERRLLQERQVQLIQAEKLASLGQMAAGIAREINNPVSYVTSNLRVLEQYATVLASVLEPLRERVEAPDAQPRTLPADTLARMRAQWEQGGLEKLIEDMPELLQESLTGARRIREIAQSLRAFVRQDDGHPQVVDLNEELESTLRMVDNALKYKCVVKRELAPLPYVTCRPTQLVQVFTNLLLNAVQAIETWGEIRVRTRQQGTEEVVVEISDTGRGMTQETVSRLFTPFFTTKPRGQGTGLGLSISRDIITRHGGKLEVRSELGQGSTFSVYLPVEPPE